MALQVFGTRKCAATRKAERFFKERDVAYHFVDLADKGISAGELDAVARVLGVEALVNKESRHYKDKGLAYMDYDAKEEILAYPLLLRTPVVRNGSKASVGEAQADWDAFARELRG